MSKYKIEDIKGVIPALLTYFDKNQEIDEVATRYNVEKLLDAGVNGLYLTGSTGECFTMTVDERKKYSEIVTDTVNGRVPIIVHVGDIGTKKSIELAKHTEEIGADAISSVPPFYWNFSADDIFNYYKELSESVSIPMIVYNIPLAGLMSKSLLERIASLDNVRGLKYTGRSHDELGALKTELGNDFMIYSGCDEMAYSGLSYGADGIIGSFYNVIPELYQEIYRAVKNYDMEKAIYLQKVADEFIFASLRYEFPTCLRDISYSRKMKMSYSRAPFINLDSVKRMSLFEDLKTIQAKYKIKELDIFDF